MYVFCVYVLCFFFFSSFYFVEKVVYSFFYKVLYVFSEPNICRMQNFMSDTLRSRVSARFLFFLFNLSCTSDSSLFEIHELVYVLHLYLMDLEYFSLHFWTKELTGSRQQK